MGIDGSNRYIRAFEVGRNPQSSKYEMHVRLRTLKNGAVIRNRMRLPHPVKTDIRICVICPPGSKAEAEAKAAGATLVGEDEVFNLVKEGIVEFERCICHTDSAQKMNKAGLGRILGPKGLMPSTKTGTVVSNVGATLKTMMGASEYRERMAVVRLAIGQLGFTPEMMQSNIKAFMEALNKDIGLLSERTSKEIHEVVSLGEFRQLLFRQFQLTPRPGSQLHQCARLPAQRRIQRPQLDTHKGGFWPYVRAPLNVDCKNIVTFPNANAMLKKTKAVRFMPFWMIAES